MLSFRGGAWKGVSELRDSPGSTGPGVMDLVCWLEVQGVETITMCVVSYNTILFGDSCIGEVDGRTPVKVKEV